MHGEVPGWIKKGRTVLYKKRRVIVTDYYFTCPCAIGDKDHHESDDLLMLKLKGVGNVPDFKVERDPSNKPPHKIRKQKDPYPPFKKGEVVLLKDPTNVNIWEERGTRAVVKNCYVTCPCVEGDIFHSPGLQTQIVELEGIGEVRSEDVIGYEAYLERKRGERRMSAVFAAAARSVEADFYIPTGNLYPDSKRKRSKKRKKATAQPFDAIKLANRIAEVETRDIERIYDQFRKRKNKRKNKR